MRNCAIHQAAVRSEIIFRHAASGKSLFETLPNLLPGQKIQAVDGADRAFLVLDNEAGQPILNDLGNGPAIVGDNRRAARHCFDHDETKRLRPIDRHKERDGAAQKVLIFPHH